MRQDETPVLEIEAGAEPLARLFSGETRGRLEAGVLPAWLGARRWYAAKDAGTPRVALLDLVPLDPVGRAALAILSATPPQQPAQIYHLPLALRADAPAEATLAEVRLGDERLRLADALADDGLVRELATRMLWGDGAQDERTGFVFRGSSARQGGDPLAGPVQRSRAEQSNTSIRVGGAMLKAIRKLEPGVHPELEMTRHLTERTEFRNAPALLGSLERVDEDGRPTALCVMQALIPNEGDGWSYTLDRLGHGDRAAQLHDLADRLGRRTAELHRALAAPSDDPAFAPEPVDAPILAEWADGTRLQARLALEALRQPGALPGGAAQEQAGQLQARARDIEARITEWAPRRLRAVRTRLHGDYHLGQVLVDENDVFIIDFEGEPMRPLAERRAKHAPLKDVAGMLRSFAYAGTAGAAAAVGERTEDARRTAAEMGERFLARYRETIRGCASWPDDPADAARLLRLFLLEKALYEVRYEAANRPDWLSTPLAGVLALLDAPAGDADAAAFPPLA